MRILDIADLHTGSIKDINYIYNVTTDIFEKELIFNKTDLVVLLGDFFDRLFKVNEDYVLLAINIMSFLTRICKRNGIKLRVVYGTESHEMNQYRLFNSHLTDPDLDMRIIETAEAEIINGKKILWLPEEYIDDQNVHYEKLFNNTYDYCFGHGIIEEGMPAIQFNTAPRSNEKRVPRFKRDQLASIAKLTVFGHYHNFTNLDRVYYQGSLFRDSFGEEEPKGYGIIVDDTYSFIENTKAYIYKTYTYEEGDPVYKDTKNLINEIRRIKDENKEILLGEKIGKIRLFFKFPADIDITFKDTIRSLLFNDKYISPIIKENSPDLISEVQEEINEEYDFVLDNSLEIVDKIYQFINKEYESTMSLDDINRYINEELNLQKIKRGV